MSARKQFSLKRYTSINQFKKQFFPKAFERELKIRNGEPVDDLYGPFGPIKPIHIRKKL